MSRATETARGTVCEVLPNSQYRVEMQQSGKTVICYVSGRMQKNKIHMILGDHVDVVLDPYGGKVSNRIVKRL